MKTFYDWCIENNREDLLNEWHPTKNAENTPHNIGYGSNKKVWWQCNKGHEWQASPNSRARGDSCPYCSNKKVLSGYNDLATTHPEIAKEWHPTKNSSIKPTMLTSGSNKKVWWKCKKGHEWEANVNNRARQNQGCPICSNKRVLQGYNDLATTHPEIAKEWHPTKNGDLNPTMVVAGSHQKVWWQCDKGHEWQAAVAWRYRGDKCPYCVNKKVLSGYNDLATTHPEIAKEWHPTKNGTLEPTDVIAGSEKKVWWLCDKGHEWQASLVNRTRQNQGCPFCSNRRVLQGYNDLATTHPEIAKEWHPTKNGELKPTMVTYGSKQKVWWQCDKGHEWETAISSRRNGGSGCPECHKKKKK